MYVVGLRFRPSGKVYHFIAPDKDYSLGEKVLVETAQGLELGQVATRPREAANGEDHQHKKIIRRASSEDLERAKQNNEKAMRALQVCKEKVAKHGLELRPVEAEYAFDGSKVTIYFTAEGRVDFRALVRDLVSALKCRVELRQIGVRDEAALLGGLGPCGRTLCCSSFLTEFKPVSIRMAKEQNLSLNPGKISGLCGRLMCCLRYESESAINDEANGGVEGGLVIAGGEETGKGYSCGGCCSAGGSSARGSSAGGTGGGGFSGCSSGCSFRLFHTDR